MAAALLEREVIYSEDVEAIFGKRPWASRSEEILESQQAAEEKKSKEEKKGSDSDDSANDSDATTDGDKTTGSDVETEATGLLTKQK